MATFMSNANSAQRLHDKGLISQGGKTATRDIVQFVA